MNFLTFPAIEQGKKNLFGD